MGAEDTVLQPETGQPEAQNASASRFAVRIINAGTSLNKNVYPDAALRAAVPLFDGVRVFVKSDAEHLSGGGKDVRNLIGRIVEPKYAPPAAGRPAGINGVIEVIDPADPVARGMAEAARRGMSDLFGLSIDAEAEGRRQGQTRVVTRFIKVRSVDVIVDPGAGGAVIGVTEAFGGVYMSHLSPLADRPPHRTVPSVQCFERSSHP
ncbi:hypothetical protein [Xanthobacter sediminis]|uniref:hypothetical protein n=1 Tax=Xanthobacter sediminis TaxID=3119926 RepID=UPI0037275559